MTPELRTSRLVLRPLALEDAVQVQPLFANWEVVRYLQAKVPWPYPPDGTETYYREVALPAIARGEQWHWTLRLLSSPEQIVGAINLMTTPDTNRGFWMGLPWQGQGLMSEACDAVTDFWFDTLGFPLLRAPKAVGNEASRGISRKQGMRVVSIYESNYVSGPHPTELFEITAEEWRAYRKRKPAQR